MRRVQRDDRAATDGELVVASVVDPQAFATVFDRHVDAIFGYLARRVPRADASDLTSETFRLAFAARARFDPAHPSARPWLYGFAVNVLRNHQRRTRREAWALRRLASVPVDPEAGDERSRDDAVDAARRWPAVAVAIAALPVDEREALLLHAWEELSYADIALATGVPIGTVRSRISRARNRLREPSDDGGQPVEDSTHHVPEEASDHG